MFREQWWLQRGAGNKYTGKFKKGAFPKEGGRVYSNQENAELLESRMGEKNLATLGYNGFRVKFILNFFII